MAAGGGRKITLTLQLYSALRIEDKSHAGHLLEFLGANPNLLLSSEGGVAPLHYAAGMGYEFTALLLKHGGDPNLRTSDGSTPLHIAVLWGHEETVLLLLRNGADPRIEDENGDTPLELALEKGYLEIAGVIDEYLCERTDTILPQFSLELRTVRYFPSPFSSLNVSPETQSSPPDHFLDYFAENSSTSLKTAKKTEIPVRASNTAFRSNRLQVSKSLSSISDLPGSYSRCDIADTPVSNGDAQDGESKRKPSRRILNLHMPVVGWKRRPMASEKCTFRKSLQDCHTPSDGCYISATCSEERDRDIKSQLMQSKTPDSSRDRVISSNLTSPLRSVISPPPDVFSSSYDERRMGNSGASFNHKLSQTTPGRGLQKSSGPTKSLSCSALPRKAFKKCSILEEDMSDSMRDFIETEADCEDETWDLEDGLNTTLTLNKQLEKMTIAERIDVTSPDHPIIELKGTDNGTLEDTLELRSSDSGCNSCDSSPEMPIVSFLSKSGKSSLENGNSAAQNEDPSVRTPDDQSGERPLSNLSNESTSSLASVVEYEYKDIETGECLIETRYPSLLSLSSNHSSPSSITSVSSVLTEVGLMDDNKLREKLLEIGDLPGPVMESTRRLYMRRLTKLIRDPALPRQTASPKTEYSFELRQYLRTGSLADQSGLERALLDSFADPSRQWREGKLKSSFNYILLDPNLSQNLPMRADTMGERDLFRTFIGAIFYIGKGKRSRPLSHFYEALSKKRKEKQSEKVKRIQDIWTGGGGVISLHCYQNTIPVEAYTREAAMIDAIGITNLTNVKRGDYYGPASTWSPQQKKLYGVHLLKRACSILLLEGERQIRPGDI